MSKAAIIVNFQHVGFHRWPDAHGKRSYLTHPHRHKFHVRVCMDVEHDQREVEFHDLIEEAETRFIELRVNNDKEVTNFGPQSCESLARRLGTTLADRYRRGVTVTVMEDGECGSVVKSLPDGSV